MLGLLLLDSVAVAVALAAAQWLASDQDGSWAGVLPLLVGVPVAVAVFGLHRLYVLDELFEGPTEYGRVIYGCTVSTLGLIVLGFWTQPASVVSSRELAALAWVLLILAVGVARFLLRRVVRTIRRRGGLTSRAIVVGAGAAGLSLARHFADLKHAGVRIVGFVDDFLPVGTPVVDGLKVLGPPSSLARVVEETGAHEVIVVPAAMAWESFRELSHSGLNLNGTAIRVLPAVRDVVAANVKVHERGFLPFLTLERFRISGVDAVLKGAMDYALALGALPVVLPVVGLAATALLVTGVRPFRVVRMVGRGGTTFRAVFLDTGWPGGVQNAVQRLLYRLGLDRLPLVLHVLRGQMSVVGPRPIPVARRAVYESWMPDLLLVKPGLTGMWALWDEPVSIDDEMRATLFYVRNYTIWLDLELLVRSVLRLVGGRWAHPAMEGGAARGRVAVH
ncbi:MAG: sugar transferase [Armatimonadota bacterium]|nr:sugar transferase [Armatimonadota bacterium]